MEIYQIETTKYQRNGLLFLNGFRIAVLVPVLTRMNITGTSLTLSDIQEKGYLSSFDP